ncbi:MAG: hypothetical protein SOV43_09210 [Selenomonadaceae bacterium]|nr:hypothetical protein [Selenomonadaceae bacterium]MDY2686333.1 hypothetical protein [Selenomonadaceae bacterium]
MVVDEKKDQQEIAKGILHRVQGMQVERPRHIQEISARYRKDLAEYLTLMRAQKDNREQRQMLYAEIKALGWCIGRPEKKIVRDIQMGAYTD